VAFIPTLALKYIKPSSTQIPTPVNNTHYDYNTIMNFSNSKLTSKTTNCTQKMLP